MNWVPPEAKGTIVPSIPDAEALRFFNLRDLVTMLDLALSEKRWSDAAMIAPVISIRAYSLQIYALENVKELLGEHLKKAN